MELELSLIEQMDAYDAIKSRFKLNSAQILTLGKLACADAIINAAWDGKWEWVEQALTFFQILPNETYGQER
jgi:predicted outer membrane lipoprotein